MVRPKPGTGTGAATGAPVKKPVLPVVRPPRWPGSVSLPNTPGFEQSAKAWLFELAPARWWHEEVLHRCPAELARMVRLHLEADIAAMQAGLRPVPDQLLGRPATRGGATDASAVYRRERDWARAMREQVKLVEDALAAVWSRTRRRRAAGERTSGLIAPRTLPE